MNRRTHAFAILVGLGAAFFDLVIASLLLGSGFETRLPFYTFEEGGPVWHDVRVAGAAEVTVEGETRPSGRVEAAHDEVRSPT